jgi:hypothetical protein
LIFDCFVPFDVPMIGRWKTTRVPQKQEEQHSQPPIRSVLEMAAAKQGRMP